MSAPRRFTPLAFRQITFTFDRVYLVGVVNVTPDSFSDGGQHDSVESAVAHGLRLIEEGADVVDVGGESTRPGARAVSAAEEAERVVPVVRALAAQARVPISVDTSKAEVAEAALAAGAEMVNDVGGGRWDARVPEVAAARGAVYVLGHARGASIAETHASEVTPPTFEDVSLELARGLGGLPGDLRQRTIVDPGLGFGKGARENLELLARAGELAAGLARPVMVGPSRKRFLGELCGRPVAERDAATVGACLAAAAAGASFLRVHDVARVRDALVVFQRVRES